jgi:L-threonylcarbamoyladenylate synthase
MQAIEPWVSEVPAYAISLARDFWPGPMTLILKRSILAKDFITGGQDSVGIRVPNHPIALALLQSFYILGGKGVAAPSANRFGHVSPTTSIAVRAELDRYLNESDQVLDGGQSMIGLESTIIDCTHERPRILRPGAITAEMVQAASGSAELLKSNLLEPRVSGSLEKHYAPRAKIILDEEPLSGQGYIALSTFVTPQGVIRLASPETIEQFAREFYESLRKADDLNLDAVVIQQPIGEGIAIAIRDRSSRAAGGR